MRIRGVYVIHKPFWPILVMTSAFVFCACFTAGPVATAMGEDGTAVMGVLSGRVIRGPTRPVERAGEGRESVPVPGVVVLISGSTGQGSWRVLTDEEGRFRIDLPPGAYRIERPSLRKQEITKDLPAIVMITEGRETRLSIRIDTGIR